MQGGSASLEQLEVYQVACASKRRVFSLVKQLPGGIRNPFGRHLCEATSSVSANIAEGYGRYSFADRRPFFRFARGSAYEVLDHLDLLLAYELANDATVRPLSDEFRGIVRMINGYLRYLRTKAASPTNH